MIDGFKTGYFDGTGTIRNGILQNRIGSVCGGANPCTRRIRKMLSLLALSSLGHLD